MYKVLDLTNGEYLLSGILRRDLRGYDTALFRSKKDATEWLDNQLAGLWLHFPTRRYKNQFSIIKD